MSLQDLRVQRGKIAAALSELVNKADYNPAVDGAAYDKGIADLNAVDAHMSAIQQVNEKLAEDTATAGVVNAAEKRGRDKGDAASLAFAKWLKGGNGALNTDDLTAIRNTMSTTTGSEGGFSVPTTVSTRLVDAVRAYGGMRDVADVIVTDSGNAMSFPASDGTTEEGEQVAENAQATAANPSFATVSLNVFKFSSKIITVPIELLQDSAIDIEAFVMRRLLTRLGRITNRLATVGAGTTTIMGAATAAAAGVVAANGSSQVSAVTYDSLVNLQHSVDPAYREAGNCIFMMNDLSLRETRKIKDTTGRPIFVPGYDLDANGSAPDRLMGSPIKVNQNMAVMAANAKSILFGDFKGYTIRDALDVQMRRYSDSVYDSRGQVGFLAFMRTGGNLVDTGALRAFVNAAS